MVVYLPKDYSIKNKYNVLFMLPGINFDSTYWLDKPHTAGGRDVDAKEIIDTMIENGECEPFIAVSICGHPNQYQDISDSGQLIKELPEYIIPYIKENYSVYEEPIHWGVIGFSNGAYLICSDIFPNSDLIKNFCLCGGCISSKRPATNDNIIYFSCGGGDTSLLDINKLYLALKEENYCRIIYIPDCNHGWEEAITGLENSLPLFFRDENLKYK